MADISQLEAALIKAYAAGDTEGARILAAEIRRQRSETPVAKSAPKQELTTAEDLASNPAVRFVEGVGSLPLGAAQALANTKVRGDGSLLDKVNPKVNDAFSAPGGNPYGNAAELNARLKQGEEMKKKGMEAKGDGSFDLAGLLGSLFSPTGAIKPLQAADASLKSKSIASAVNGGLFSGSTPVTEGDDFWKSKRDQVVAGTLFGGAIPTLAKGANAVSNVVKEVARPFTETGRAQILYKYLEGLTGDAKAQVIAALQKAGELVPGSKPTVGEAVADTPEAAALAAFQAKLSRVGESSTGKAPVGVKFVTREAQQEAARKAAIADIAKTSGDLKAAEEARTAATAPLREDALAQANIGGVKTPQLLADIEAKEASKADALQTWGKTKTTAVQQDELAKNQYPVPGYPKFPYRYTHQAERVGEFEGAAADAAAIARQRQMEKEFKEFQLKSLQDEGYFPLMATPVIDKIDSMANSPGAATLTKDVFGKIRDKIAERTKENGVIDANDLYAIRKEIGNDIATLAKDSNTWDKRLTGGLEKNIQSAIDNAIEKAGGGGWKSYLKTYQDMSQPINQMKVGQFLQSKLTGPMDQERAGQFAQAMRDAPGTIKKASGQSRYSSLDEVLTPEQMKATEGVLADLQRLGGYKELAGKVGVDGTNLAEKGYKAPHLLSTPATVANYALKLFRQGADDKIAEFATTLMLDPQKMAVFLQSMPQNQLGKNMAKMAASLPPNVRKQFIEAAQRTPGLVAGQEAQ